MLRDQPVQISLGYVLKTLSGQTPFHGRPGQKCLRTTVLSSSARYSAGHCRSHETRVLADECVDA